MRRSVCPCKKIRLMSPVANRMISHEVAVLAQEGLPARFFGLSASLLGPHWARRCQPPAVEAVGRVDTLPLRRLVDTELIPLFGGRVGHVHPLSLLVEMTPCGRQVGAAARVACGMSPIIDAKRRLDNRAEELADERREQHGQRPRK